MLIKRKVKIKNNDNEIVILHDGRMNVENTAKYIDCSLSQLRKYMMIGIAPSHFRIVNKIYFYKDDIDKWMELNKMSPTFTRNRLKALKKQADERAKIDVDSLYQEIEKVIGGGL